MYRPAKKTALLVKTKVLVPHRHFSREVVTPTTTTKEGKEKVGHADRVTSYNPQSPAYFAS